MNRWCGKIAAVTGASSGIGAAIAKALVEEGMTVVGLARRKEKMEKEMECVSDKGKFIAHKCDVTSECEVIDAFKWLKKNLGGVHVLVNNAGIAIPGKIIETDSSVWEKTINSNILALLYCTRQAVDILKDCGEEGHIVNINSILGHRIPRTPAFQLNVYSATKFAVTSITQTLEDELYGSKIKVSSISPGLVKTAIFDFNKEYTEWPLLKPEDIANAVVFALSTGPNVQATELTIRPVGEIF